MFEHVCAAAFSGLGRSDQRRRGREYVQGLLGTRGRKSIRNIAGPLGGPPVEQSLHHFVNTSTWDWKAVRQALVREVTGDAPPLAWVVQPMVIPKAGENSVGVDRRFFPAFGRVLNGQEAIGVWAAWADRSIPVNWRLHLSRSWLDDPLRRTQAAIPDSVVAESLGTCAVESYLGMMADWDLPVRPVVLDGRGTDVAGTVRGFQAADVPVIIRVHGDCPLTAAEFSVPGWGEEVTAERIMAAARNLRCAFAIHPEGLVGAARASAVAAVPVQLAPSPAPAARSGDRPGLQLVGVWHAGRRGPSELWLTSLPNARVPEALALSRLTERVERDFDEISERVGIRDFAGRSFGGWHRHITLASLAHAVVVLSRSALPHVALRSARVAETASRHRGRRSDLAMRPKEIRRCT